MPWYRHLLWPFTMLYGMGVWIRNRLFDLGVLPSTEFDIPIICIGNLETGGTGKSPLVMYTASLLIRSGFSVGVLSRGYGRKSKGFVLVEETMTAENAGDEPLQLKMRFLEVTVAVCESRVEGIEKLLSHNTKLDVVILDDGFQHRWVKPSLSVLVTPSKRPFWKNHLLPVGDLRESSSEIKRANAVVVSGAESVDDKLNCGKPMFYTGTTSNVMVQFSGLKKEAAEVKRVALFSGIANSDRFEKSASEHVEVFEHRRFTDHHMYTKQDISELRKLDSLAATIDALVTTEKDAARLKNSGLLQDLGETPVFYLPIEINFLEDHEHKFDKLIMDHVRKD